MSQKLSYKIVGRRVLDGDKFGQEYVDVEWCHEDGPVTDTVLLPKKHPVIHPLMGDHTAPQEYEEVVCGQRDVIKDCVTVPMGTPDHMVHLLLEQKRVLLAKQLKLS